MPDNETLYTRIFQETAADIAPRVLKLGAIAAFLGGTAWLFAEQYDIARVTSICVAAILLGICAIESLRWLRGQYRLLTLSPEGLRDTNIAPETIPWTSVEKLKIVATVFRGMERNIAVEVKLNNSAWDKLTLTRSAKINKYQTGAMWIMHIGRNADFQTFFETLRSYARAHGGKVD